MWKAVVREILFPIRCWAGILAAKTDDLRRSSFRYQCLVANRHPRSAGMAEHLVLTVVRPVG